jgi:Ca-activated chloride channel family protein
LAASLCYGADRIEIVLDTSAEMWKPFSSGIPKIVAVRSALTSFVGSPIVSDMEFEIGLRTIGGERDFVEGFGCTDSSVAVDRSPVDVRVWSSALDRLDARGGRALVHAVEEAARDLADREGQGRIVVLITGDDQCQRDLEPTLERIRGMDSQVSLRFIGLDIEHGLASSLVPLAPTRNVSDPSLLVEALKWSMLPPEAIATRAEWLELYLSRGGAPITGATLHLAAPFKDEVFTTALEEGKARVRLLPGRYWATVESEGGRPLLLAHIMHVGRDGPLEASILDVPEVTLEVVPERPSAGATASVQYWGAPTGKNWIATAPGGSPPGEYLERAPASGRAGEVMLPLPDAPHDLRAVFVHELGSGIEQILGRIDFETERRRMAVDAPTRIENGTAMSLGWSDDVFEGDFITIVGKGGELTNSEFCAPATGRGSVSVRAPSVAGDYVIRYFSRRGRLLDSVDLEVFEILATLDGPAEVAPGSSFSVDWTGPAGDQDFLSIAAVDDGEDQYRSFTPAAAGSPARLTAPREPGEYELRYVRAADGEVLARAKCAVKAVAITLEAPPFIDAGTRFEVGWHGTPGAGDFVAVAKPHWGRRRHLDWSYTDFGSPVSLAAPFETGLYEVRYISGQTKRIVDRREIEIR